MSKHWRILSSGFIEVDVSANIQSLAEQRNRDFYAKYGNAGTHRKDKSRQRVTGYLAELAVKSVFNKLEFSQDDNIDFTFGNTSFDVKAQGCNTVPELKYVGTLYKEQEKRAVDFYIFTRVKNDSTKVWITGFISKKRFLQNAQLIESGVANNNFTYDQARYEIPYFKLIKPNKILVREQNESIIHGIRQ